MIYLILWLVAGAAIGWIAGMVRVRSIHRKVR